LGQISSPLLKKLKHKSLPQGIIYLAENVGFDGLTRINEISAKNEETAQIVEKRYIDVLLTILLPSLPSNI